MSEDLFAFDNQSHVTELLFVQEAEEISLFCGGAGVYAIVVEVLRRNVINHDILLPRRFLRYGAQTSCKKIIRILTRALSLHIRSDRLHTFIVVRAQTAGILALSAPLLVCLAGFAVYLFVVSRAIPVTILDSGLFNLVVLSLVHAVVAVAIVVRSSGSDCMAIDQVNYNRILNRLPVKIVVHDQSLAIWQEHQTLWNDLVLGRPPHTLGLLIWKLAWVIHYLIVNSILACILLAIPLRYLLCPLTSSI